MQISEVEKAAEKVGFVVDGKSFRIQFLDMNTASCYPLLLTVPTIITTATEADNRWIIND